MQMRLFFVILATLGVLSLVAAIDARAQSPEERLRITLVADEAEAVLSILEAREAGATPTAAAWERLHSSEGYRRLKEREAAMRVPFTDDEFRSFVLDDALLERRAALRQALESWKSADLDGAARRALTYLPDGVVIQARVYLVIKPKANSFVFDLDGDPAIFLYLDPDVSAPKFENTVAHELHHIGLAAACPDEDTALPPGVRRARQWASAFGEGMAMLAAAGGPDTHPHVASEPEERAVWERDVTNIERDMRRIETFLSDLAEERLTDEEEIRTRGFELIVSDGVPQGPFYTVGWHVAATVERASSRDRLLAALCDPAALLAEYNRAAYGANQRGRNLPLWSERLVEALRGPEAGE